MQEECFYLTHTHPSLIGRLRTTSMYRMMLNFFKSFYCLKHIASPTELLGSFRVTFGSIRSGHSVVRYLSENGSYHCIPLTSISVWQTDTSIYCILLGLIFDYIKQKDMGIGKKTVYMGGWYLGKPRWLGLYSYEIPVGEKIVIYRGSVTW